MRTAPVPNRSLRRGWLPRAATCVLAGALALPALAAAAGPAQRTLVVDHVVGATAALQYVTEPLGIAASGGDDALVYVVDRGNARVQVFTPTGQALGTIGSRGNGANQFFLPSDVAVSPDGRFVYVVDEGHRQIKRFEPELACFLPPQRECFSANQTKVFGYRGQLMDPTGLTVDRAGQVYVADRELHRVVVYDADGRHLPGFGEVGTGRGELLNPSDVAIHPDGSIWVADTGNDRISMFTGGNGQFQFKGQWNGTGNDRLFRPSGITIDASGDFVVRDFDRNYQVPQASRYRGQNQATWSVRLGIEPDDHTPFQGAATLPDGTVLLSVPRSAETPIVQVLTGGGQLRWGPLRSIAPDQRDSSSAVAADEALLAVVDGGLHRAVVLKNDPARRYKFLSMLDPLLTPQFNLSDPRGIAIRRTGAAAEDAQIYVADGAQHSVYIASAEGELLGRWGDGTARNGEDGLSTPSAVALAPNGEVYIADTGNNRIVRHAPFPSTAVLNTIGNGAGQDPGELQYPMAVTYGPGERVFVLEANTNRLQMFAPGGAFLYHWDFGSRKPDVVEPGELWMPIALATEGRYLYVLESDGPWGDHVRLQVLDPRAGVPLADSVVATVPPIGKGPGPAPDELWAPRGVAATADGRVVIADGGNHRLVVYRWSDGVLPTEPPPATATDLPPTATPTATDLPPSSTPTTEPPTATGLPPTATATTETPQPTTSPPPEQTPVASVSPTTAVPPASATAATATRAPTNPTPSTNVGPTPRFRHKIVLPMVLRGVRINRVR